MPASHTPFAIWNRAVNPVVKGVLRSPAHRLVDRRLALITVTGRRSGDLYTFPVGYERAGDHLTITVGWPNRKRWWRNLLDAASVTVVLDGIERTGRAQAFGDEQTGVRVEVELDPQ